jgi:L-asparaginase / beta-aspartyl-peptidase
MFVKIIIMLVKYCLVLYTLCFFQVWLFGQDVKKDHFTLVIHGGAGTIKYDPKNPDKQKKYEAELNKALQIGYDTLSKGATALDAVEVVVRYLEDCPLFNAGKGAVFTNKGINELDASIMNGNTLEAGSIAGVTTIKNPITTARAVMEKSNHVMLIGKGAEEFAKEQGHIIVPTSYFYTEERWKGLQKIKDTEKKLAEYDTTHLKKLGKSNLHIGKNSVTEKYGTVGAVALDKYGNLAAATSTGGMTNKKYGRVGDVPIIGAGTYANNQTCAISCTGWGEYFIRLVMAKSVSDLIEYKSMKIDDAAKEMIHTKLPNLGGDGGLVGVDKDGNITMQFNSEGMYRGYIKSNGERMVAVFK